MQNNNYQTPFIDFEDVWNGLKPQLDEEAARREKRKRRFLFFWFTIAVVAIGSAFFVMTKYQPQSSKKTIVEQLDEKANRAKKQLQVDIANNQVAENGADKTEPKALGNTQQLSESNDAASGVSTKESEPQNQCFAVKKGKHTTAKRISLATKEKTNEYKFTNAKSYTNIIALKADIDANNLVMQNVVTSNYSNNKIIDNAVEKPQLNEEPGAAKTEDNEATKPSKTQTATKKKPAPILFGLQWTTPIRNGFNYIDINANNNLLTQAIPQFWVARQFGKKHTLMLAFNPYSQYYSNNKDIINSKQYDITIYSGNQLNTKPETIVYTEAIAINKLISAEASLTYQYQISSKFKIGVSVGNNWIQGALIQNRVVKNYINVTRDSIYGVDKNDKEWSYLKSSFVQGKFELNYQFKKVDIGVSISKPIGNVFTNLTQNRTPINTNLFLRWRIK